MAPNTFQVSDPAFTSTLAKLREDSSMRPAAVRSIVRQLTTMVAKDAITAPPPPGEKIAVIVILRSGLAMMEPFTDALPEDTDMVIHHLGLFRERQTLQPIEYYNKLPAKADNIKHAYILDPLVATGGTCCAAISILREWNIDSITFLCLVASKAGLEKVSSAWPERTKVYVGAVDDGLDEKGFVKPGVGDIGDRLFGTGTDAGWSG
ncbi:uracil phosphoribosyltransferase [Geosmithia morbida]|uniref:uracil phosphoribosyltransferase n=1 Tax=Geosmithia morbida TaxID=1094350 RepID=A0A9P5D6Z9_9HYPO|nr:uracil phosphoribosyltransferase [Geosmithia morbida]KAF4126091.1 uracil phosphoribosyltransferase [Geosmithia morbida]